MVETAPFLPFRYPYEEFAGDIKAMRMVQQWQYTSRFGHVGTAQTSRANNARVVEYFADCNSNLREAAFKAELFLSICDYVGRHAALFVRNGLVEEEGERRMSVAPELLRAVHTVFTIRAEPAGTDPVKVLALARALQELKR